MPFVNIRILKGHSQARKDEISRRVTAAISEVAELPKLFAEKKGRKRVPSRPSGGLAQAFGAVLTLSSKQRKTRLSNQRAAMSGFCSRKPSIQPGIVGQRQGRVPQHRASQHDIRDIVRKRVGREVPQQQHHDRGSNP